MKLYGLTTGIGYYYVVANDPTEAELKLLNLLNENDYGYSRNREVTRIDLLAKEADNRYLTGKFLVL